MNNLINEKQYDYNSLNSLFETREQKYNYNDLNSLFDEGQSNVTQGTQTQNIIQPTTQDIDLYGKPIPKAPDVDNVTPSERVTLKDYAKAFVPFGFSDSKMKVGNELASGAKSLGKEVLNVLNTGINGIKDGTGYNQVVDTNKLRDEINTHKAQFENVNFRYKDLVTQGRAFLGNEEAMEQARAQKQQIDNDFTKYLSQTMPNIKNAVFDGNTLWILTKDGQEIKVDEGFLNSLGNTLEASAYETAGGISGGMSGGMIAKRVLKNAKGNPIKAGVGVFLGTVAGDMVGSSIGRMVDIMRNAMNTRQELDFLDVVDAGLDSAGASAILNPVATGAVKALAKPAQTVTKPVVNLVDRFVVSPIKNGNIKGATSELGQYGSSIDEAADTFAKQSKYETTGSGKNYNIADEITEAVTGSKKEQDYLAAQTMKDPSLTKGMIDYLSTKPAEAKDIAKNISERTNYIVNTLKDTSSSPEEIFKNIKSYEDGVKAQYKNIKEELTRLTPEERVNFSEMGIVEKIRGFEDLVGSVDGKASIGALANRLEKRGAMGIDDLIDVRSEINTILSKQKNYLGKKEINEIKNLVDDSIKSIIETTKAPKELKNTFYKAVDDYRVMKELQNTKAYEKMTNLGISQKKYDSALIEEAKSINNELSQVTKHLTQEQKEGVELRMLYSLVNKSTKEFKGGNKAIKFSELPEALNTIQFTTPKAKQTSKILNELSELYKMDDILMSVSDVAKKGTNSGSIATSIWGKLNMASVKNIWDKFSKLIPIIGDSSALQYHIMQGLKKTKTPTEFLDFLQKRPGVAKEVKDIVSELTPKEIQKEKRGIWNVTFNNKSATQVKTKDLDDFVQYEKGSRTYGGKHIRVNHIGNKKDGSAKVGEVSKEELLNIGEVLRKGSIDKESLQVKDDYISYVYNLKKGDVSFGVVVKETKDNKKILSFFSDRDFIKKGEGTPLGLKPSPLNDIISQNKYLNALYKKIGINKPKETKSKNFSPYIKQFLQNKNKQREE